MLPATNVPGNRAGECSSRQMQRLVYKNLANIIEQANAAYEARDAAQAQMTSLKQQADKEHQEFEKECKLQCYEH